jgi:hypothetical protein
VVLKRLENGEQVSRKALYSEVLNAGSKTKEKVRDQSTREGLAPSVSAGPDLLRAEESQTDMEGNRSRMVAELIIRRLSRKDYELIMDGMNWGVWNQVLVWMRAARIVDSERVELIRPGVPGVPSLETPVSNLQ